MKVIYKLMAVVTLGFFISTSAYALQEGFDIEGALEDLGISKDYTATDYKKLQDLMQQKVSQYTVLASTNPDKEEHVEEALIFMNFAISDLEDADDRDEVQKAMAYYMAIRVLGSVESGFALESEDRPKKSIKEYLKILRNFIPYHSVPYESDIDTPLNEKYSGSRLEREVSKQARGLFDDKGNLVSDEQIAKMSIRQISELEPIANHPAWYTKKEIDAALADARVSGPGVSWRNNLKTIEQQIQQTAHPDFDIERARNVVFFKSIGANATSPKISVKDAYGVKWKMKWGSEVQSEQVANRLYVAIGGKYNDPIFSKPSTDRNSMILVLNKEDKGCDEIASVENLKACMMTSKFEFLLDKNIIESGQFTSDSRDPKAQKRSDEIKALLPTAFGNADKLDGRTYVVFNEVSMELKPKTVLRGWAAPMGDDTAENDRVARGLTIFNYWIKNTDAKDDNNRMALIENDEGEKEIVEFQHDLGAWGPLGRAGHFAKMSTGRSFIGIGWPSFKYGRAVVFFQSLLYKPDAFKNVTYADARWMAKRIAQLSRQEIEFAVAATNWPSFTRNLLVTKYLRRRNRIAKAFKVEEYINGDRDPQYQDVITVNLSTPAGRAEAAQAFDVSACEISKEMMRSGFINSLNGTMKNKHGKDISYEEKVIYNGKIKTCRQSVIINVLEKTLYPSGIRDRLVRHKDDKALNDDCVFTANMRMRSAVMDVTSAQFVSSLAKKRERKVNFDNLCQ